MLPAPTPTILHEQKYRTRSGLTANGFGGYTSLEHGFPYSGRGTGQPHLAAGCGGERKFSVWLDNVLIYTDCPELDNRIGHLQLPMNDWFRDDPIIISLPRDYLGKTLTIAQSFPEWAETSRIEAYPTTVRLYCGYAYESGLISETTRITLLAALLGLEHPLSCPGRLPLDGPAAAGHQFLFPVFHILF